MPTETREVSPGPNPRSVITEDGICLQVPIDWILVPPGDPALSRRIKAAGPHWLVREKKGRRIFSRGIWAQKEVVERLVATLTVERAAPSYQKKLATARTKREQEQKLYAAEFEAKIVEYLRFDEAYQQIAFQLAKLIADHAVPVGSGTVARTQRISVEKRAEAATIAWMRHQTTSYDDLKIPRVKGMRREVRRMLAERSVRLLKKYRQGVAIDSTCPLKQALAKLND